MTSDKASVMDIERLKTYFDNVLDPLNSRSYRAKKWTLDKILDWYEDSTIQCAHKMMGELKGKRVLEIGFGMGMHLIWLARKGALVLGIDISEDRFAATKKLIEKENLSGHINLVCGDIINADFADKKFDVIYGHDILMYIGGDYLSFIKKTNSLLAPGGKMIIVEALNRHPAARLYRRVIAPREFRYFTTYFDSDSLSVFKNSYRSFAADFFYLLAPVAFIWKNWIMSKKMFDYFERSLVRLDKKLMGIFPVLKRYCWRVVFEVRK